MKRHFIMSTKEANRIPVIKRLAAGEVKARQAASELGLSVRQARRLKKRYQREGVLGLVHKGCGRPSNRRIAGAEIERAMKIVRVKYYDFGPTFALEKLRENHEVGFSRETLRKAMVDEGIWKPKRKRLVRLHQMRPRREREGELVQIDGSPHYWFEERGPDCNLLIFIDDATGKLMHLQFVEEETTNAYFEATYVYIKTYGKPAAFYMDRHSVFRINTRKGGASSVGDDNGLTQFGRAMDELNIDMIFAGTPQAKGRVEKAGRTLQDRLVKEMRLRGIKTIKEGNKYLPEFIKAFNQKFGVSPADPTNAQRLLSKGEKPRKILVKKEVRTLSRNLEFQYKNRLYQIQTPRPTYAMRNAPILVAEDWGKKVSVYYKGKRLKYKVVKRQKRMPVVNSKTLNKKADRAVGEPWRPPEDHPWKHFVI